MSQTANNRLQRSALRAAAEPDRYADTIIPKGGTLGEPPRQETL